MESKYGKRSLLDKNGHVFTLNRINAARTKNYWQCRDYKRSDRKCPARATTNGGGQVLVWTGQHNHN